MKYNSINSREIRVRSFSHKGSLFLAAIKGLVILLAGGVNVSYCASPKFNKVSPPFSMDVHTICLIGGTTLNCVLAFYSLEYLLLFFFSLLIDHLLLPLRRPSDRCRRVVCFHNNWYQNNVNVKISAIKFDIQKFNSVINSSSWQLE